VSTGSGLAREQLPIRTVERALQSLELFGNESPSLPGHNLPRDPAEEPVEQVDS
jgi:hypothetical protein